MKVELSDADVAQIEAELESWCQDSDITLHDIEAELIKALQRDDIDASDDGLNQLTGFKLFVDSAKGVDTSRQGSLALLREAIHVLVESNGTLNCNDHHHHKTLSPDVEYLMNPITQDSRHALVRGVKSALVESDADNSDTTLRHYDRHQSTYPTDSNLMTITKDESEITSTNASRMELTDVITDYTINYEPLGVDARLAVAIDNAKERTRFVEQQLQLRKLRLDQRQEQLQFKRSTRVIQNWFRRTIFIRRASICTTIIRIICRGLTRRGLRAFSCWNATIHCQRICRGFVIRRRLVVVQKQRSSIIMSQIIRRVLTGFGLRALCRWKSAVVIQRIYRGFVTRLLLASARRRQSSIQICQLICRVFAHRGVRALHRWKVQSIRKNACMHMCLTLCKALSRRGFLALYHWNTAVTIQSLYRGSVIRKRLLAIRNRDFAYVDSEMESMLYADPNLLPRFDETECESDWSPSMPIPSSDTNVSTDLSRRPVEISKISNGASSDLSDQNESLKLPENDTSGCNNMHDEKVVSEWQASQRENKAMLQWKQHMEQNLGVLRKGTKSRSFAHGLRKR
jgi:hypothetical protein